MYVFEGLKTIFDIHASFPFQYKLILQKIQNNPLWKTEIKFHNSFPIGGFDITRHANSLGRTHAKRTFFRTEHPLHAKLYKNVEKNNSNMAYNDSWSTWEQKGRAEPRREKNMRRVKTTARTFAGKPDAVRPPAAANKFAIAFDSSADNWHANPASRQVDSSLQHCNLPCHSPLHSIWNQVVALRKLVTNINYTSRTE